MGAERALDAAALAVPPHSIEAEQSVLGALLLDNRAAVAVGALLAPRDFYAPDHGAVYRTVQALLAASKPADVITVYEAGGHDIAYLNALAAGVPSASNAGRYAEIVREHAQRREVMRIADAAREQARAALAPVPAVIDGVIEALLALRRGDARYEPQPLRELTLRALDELQARADGLTDSIETGFADLDRLTGGGGRLGELWVLGALPGMGKSALVNGLARHVGQAHRALLMTMEDSAMVTTQRMLAAAGGVNLADIRQPQHAPQSMWERLTVAVDELAGLQVWVDEQPALTVADVRRKIQQVEARHGAPALVIVDYLQQMDGEGAENRNRELGRIAYGLQALAKDARAWIVLLSQLSREAAKRSGPPQMSDLRDSGDIEAAARWIGMLHREYVRKPRPELLYWAQLHVCKHSNGPTGMIDLYFDGALQRFGNWEGPSPARDGAS